MTDVVKEKGGITRRRMVGYLIAGPTLAAGVSFGRSPEEAKAALPTVQPTDAYDLSDLLIDSTLATSNQIVVTVNPDGTVSFNLPRSENGQGLTTSFAMLIADELDVPIEKVKITLADANPNLVFNQFTGGSVATQQLYSPIRFACAAVRQQMAATAAKQFGVDVSALTIADGVISAAGQSLTYAQLSKDAAVTRTTRSDAKVKVKRQGALKLVGTEMGRLDARDIVTGKKTFAMDLKVLPDAKPVVMCRPPTINGNAEELLNKSEVERMPGILQVLKIPNTNDNDNGTILGGIAIRGETFGQCIDAVRKCKVRWSDGSAAGKTAASVKKELQAAQLPMTPPLPGQKVIEEEFTFHFRPGDPLEPNCAVAWAKPDSCEVWAAMKSPIWAKQRIAKNLNLPDGAVTCHVVEGGGSFGRHLFNDAPFEAAHVSRALGNKPIKLMWTRADMPRQGRCQPMKVVRNRFTHDGKMPTTFSQRMASVQTDFTQGLGEILTAFASTPPGQNFIQYSQTVYNLTANLPYNAGPVDMLLNEIYEYNTFNTSSVRNIYSPEVRCSSELLVDKLAGELGKDPMDFRLEFARDARMKAVLERVKKESEWGRSLPAGVAQGVGVHREYKGFSACVMEVDTRPSTVNRKKTGGKTGPRVQRVTFVIDVGLPINILGLKAQMMGGIMDGIGQCFTYCLHLDGGRFLEASWDNAFYTRQWNVPPRVDIFVMEANQKNPGGAGEAGVAASMSAAACAYSRAVGKMQTTFPVTYDDVGFKPYPFEPPIPESPKDGLKYRNTPKQR